MKTQTRMSLPHCTIGSRARANTDHLKAAGMTAAKNRYPRHRPHPRGRRLHAMRLEVCTRDGYRCADCGLSFPVPPGWDGTHPLFVFAACKITSKHPLPWNIIRLELGHNLSWLDGGQFEAANFRALCTICNIAQGREARTA
jgi:5-methylcytosine-specific restriction endonuclease McrA